MKSALRRRGARLSRGGKEEAIKRRLKKNEQQGLACSRKEKVLAPSLEVERGKTPSRKKSTLAWRKVRGGGGAAAFSSIRKKGERSIYLHPYRKNDR